MLFQPAEIRESQFENLVDGSAGQFAGADCLAGGKDVDEVAIKLGQGADLDPVGVAGDWLGAVFPVVVIVGVTEIPTSASIVGINRCPVIDSFGDELAEFCISCRNQVFIRKVEGASAQGRAVLFWVPLRCVVRKNHLVNNSSDADEAIGIKFEAVNFKYLAHLLSSTAVWTQGSPATDPSSSSGTSPDLPSPQLLM